MRFTYILHLGESKKHEREELRKYLELEMRSLGPRYSLSLNESVRYMLIENALKKLDNENPRVLKERVDRILKSLEST